MKILIDICHPAHFHFFKNPIKIFKELGHEILITSRDKEITIALIENEGWEHVSLCSSAATKSGLFKELMERDVRLYKLVRRFRPDVMAAIGGIFIAQVGFVARIPSVVFYDTENAKLQNLLTYPFASVVSVPDCYEGWVPKHTFRYPGYHELSYLHPDYFQPDANLARKNGLAETGDTYLVRVVAWNANHDIGEAGWSPSVLRDVLSSLARRGKVLISAESGLPDDLEKYRYRGDPSEIHHLMAHCRLMVGESATMASEAVVLGVPAIYAANTGRGYCNEQEQRYGMLKNVREVSSSNILEAVDELLEVPASEINGRWDSMLNSMVDVPGYVTNLIESAGTNLPELKRERSV